MEINKNCCVLSEDLKSFFKNSKSQYELKEYDKNTDTNIKIKIKVKHASCLFEHVDKNLQKYFASFFKSDSCADYILLNKNNDIYDIHIFELCKTYNNKKEDLALQLEGAFLRINAILHYCKQIKINNYYFYCVSENIGASIIDNKFMYKGKKIKDFYPEKLKLNHNSLFYTESNQELNIYILKSDFNKNHNILEYDIDKYFYNTSLI